MNITENTKIENFSKPYLIAELGSNHNGDMELAKKLILQAKEAGADCVKFQSWSKDSIFARKKYEENCFLADDYRNRNDYTLEEIVDEYAISEKELLEMKLFADEVGIDCTSTPFSRKEADFLVNELNAPFIKVASMDLNNYPFLEYLAKFNKHIVLSTGLSDLSEIDEAIRTIEKAGNKNLSILHCVATYPPEDSDINLNNIVTLRKLYPDYPIGFSDHSIGTAIPLASVALGAAIIEKHFTLDKDMEGWDHKVSATKEEMAEIISGAERIVSAMGSYRIVRTESDERRAEFRRSIVLTRAMKAGETIGEGDIDFKRPGTGIAPGEMKNVLGRKLKHDLAYDHILTMNDFL
ncbi:MAG: N-acetylneuraminate synthase family protein [Amphritea sp.]|nr:N-acetylneuraminate synthase family protein [Amphritea sp.]